MENTTIGPKASNHSETILKIIFYFWNSNDLQMKTHLINFGFPLSECELVKRLQCVDSGYFYEGPGLLIRAALLNKILSDEAFLLI